MSRSLPPPDARRCALEALTAWEDTSRYAADLLEEQARRMRLSSADRGLAQELLYGVIRNLYLLDELIDRFRRGSIKPQTQNLLRLGLYQLFLSGIAEHAAVNETVSLARSYERSLVNAILRSAQREKEAILQEMERWSLEDRWSHPQFLLRRWEDQYGREATEALCRWNNSPPPVYARLNPLAPQGEALEALRREVEPRRLDAPWSDFFRLEGSPDPDWLRQGLIYIQDPSTALACHLLNAQPGECILDACAAPGGKSALIAAGMQNQGQLIASDISPSRLQQLGENLTRLAVTCAEVRQIDWAKAEGPQDLPQFDGILLDAPCSNTGSMRRRVDVRWRLQERDFERHAAQQLALLRALVPHLKPGGRLVYSTCSLENTENEAVLEASGLRVEEVQASLPWRDGYDGAFAAVLRA